MICGTSISTPSAPATGGVAADGIDEVIDALHDGDTLFSICSPIPVSVRGRR
jgi:hypothetical protein